MANGTVQTQPRNARAETAPVQTATAPSQTGSEEEKKRRGSVPTMPLCVVLKRPDGKVLAEIISPKGERFGATGRGQGSAMGALVDEGFHLSSLSMDGPAWISSFIPKDHEIIGYASITGFPLPKQG